MLIKNIYVYDDSTNLPILKNVLINADNSWEIINPAADIRPIEQNELEVIDANKHYTLMPGMLDAHLHGQGGIDFADAKLSEKGLATLCSELGKTGLSYTLATLVSLSISELKDKLRIINSFVIKQNQQPNPGSTRIVGVHLEGPFISKDCKGAHDEKVLQEYISLGLFKEIITMAPEIKEWKITLDPEIPGALEFIKASRELEKEDIFVKIFIGHCNPSDMNIISEAIAAGAIGFTHLGNACKETCSRTKITETTQVQSNLVKWVLDNPELCPKGVELIVDGVHLSESFVHLIHNTIKDKIVLVTDALGPSGLGDGTFKLGSLDICRVGPSFYRVNPQGDFVLKEGPSGMERTLAGSAASLAFCVEQYSQFIKSDISNQAELMRHIYTSAIKNPRISSLSKKAIEQLPDSNNFVIFNNQGQTLMSLCNGLIVEHQVIPRISKGKGLLTKKGLFSGRNDPSDILETTVKDPTYGIE